MECLKLWRVRFKIVTDGSTGNDGKPLVRFGDWWDADLEELKNVIEAETEYARLPKEKRKMSSGGYWPVRKEFSEPEEIMIPLKISDFAVFLTSYDTAKAEVHQFQESI